MVENKEPIINQFESLKRRLQRRGMRYLPLYKFRSRTNFHSVSFSGEMLCSGGQKGNVCVHLEILQDLVKSWLFNHLYLIILNVFRFLFSGGTSIANKMECVSILENIISKYILIYLGMRKLIFLMKCET